MQSQGDRVRIMLSVVDTNQMRQVDTITVEDNRSNVFDLQDEAVAELARVFDLTEQPMTSAAIPTEPGAGEFYLQGRGYLQRSDKLDQVNSAIAQFERALALDDDYALAHAGLCEAHQAKYSLTSAPEWMAAARASCDQAVAIDNQLPETQITIGNLLNATGDHRGAVEHFERALQTSPRSPEAYAGLGEAYSGLDEPEKAEETYRRALALRPWDWTTYKQLGLFYYRRGDYEQAIEQYRQIVALTPDNAHGYANLGSFLYHANRPDEAVAAWERALDLEPEPHQHGEQSGEPAA